MPAAYRGRIATSGEPTRHLCPGSLGVSNKNGSFPSPRLFLVRLAQLSAFDRTLDCALINFKFFGKSFFGNPKRQVFRHRHPTTTTALSLSTMSELLCFDKPDGPKADTLQTRHIYSDIPTGSQHDMPTVAFLVCRVHVPPPPNTSGKSS